MKYEIWILIGACISLICVGWAMRQASTCTWYMDETMFNETDTWLGTCDLAWIFPEGGPIQNGVNYCPNCGRKIVIKKEIHTNSMSTEYKNEY